MTGGLTWENSAALALELEREGFSGMLFTEAGTVPWMMIAAVTGLLPGEFVHSFGDVHLYLNHTDQARLQLGRSPLPLPQLWLNPEVKNLFSFDYEDIKLLNYESHPSIKAPIAV